jgi:hypothetical protein
MVLVTKLEINMKYLFPLSSHKDTKEQEEEEPQKSIQRAHLEIRKNGKNNKALASKEQVANLFM